MSVDYEPLSHAHRDDPYPVYRELRDRAPVHHASSDIWVLSRYDDVLFAFKNPELFSSRVDRDRKFQTRSRVGRLRFLALALTYMWRMRVRPSELRDSRMLISSDGDTHAALRGIVNRGFTPRRIVGWEERVRAIVRECIDEIEKHPRFDLVERLAIPVPVTVIAEMLGIESERYADFKRWSDAIIEGATGSATVEGISSRMLDAMVELRRYLRPIVKERRRSPADDLISVLVAAEEGEATLSDADIFNFVLLLLVAGNETTTNLIGNAVDALFAHPEQLERVLSEPNLIPALIEETLRYDAPVQQLSRRCVRDVELHGVRIPAEANVSILIGSANRDERRFADPDRFDVTRDTRGHLGFGFGAHFCLGASLARLEALAALEAFLPRLGRLRRATPEREFLDSYVVRGRSRLELEAVV